MGCGVRGGGMSLVWGVMVVVWGEMGWCECECGVELRWVV